MTCNSILEPITTDMGALKRPAPIHVFPCKLFTMLSSTEEDGKEHIVSWLPNDQGFRVHDQKAFVAEILPTHFRQSAYRSFQRQLNIYGFARCRSGVHSGSYSHPLFLRGRMDLAAKIMRTNCGSKTHKKLKHISIAKIDEVTEDDMALIKTRLESHTSSAPMTTLSSSASTPIASTSSTPPAPCLVSSRSAPVRSERASRSRSKILKKAHSAFTGENERQEEQWKKQHLANQPDGDDTLIPPPKLSLVSSVSLTLKKHSPLHFIDTDLGTREIMDQIDRNVFDLFEFQPEPVPEPEPVKIDAALVIRNMQLYLQNGGDVSPDQGDSVNCDYNAEDDQDTHCFGCFPEVTPSLVPTFGGNHISLLGPDRQNGFLSYDRSSTIGSSVEL